MSQQCQILKEYIFYTKVYTVFICVHHSRLTDNLSRLKLDWKSFSLSKENDVECWHIHLKRKRKNALRQPFDGKLKQLPWSSQRIYNCSQSPTGPWSFDLLWTGICPMHYFSRRKARRKQDSWSGETMSDFSKKKKTMLTFPWNSANVFCNSSSNLWKNKSNVTINRKNKVLLIYPWDSTSRWIKTHSKTSRLLQCVYINTGLFF